VVEWVFDVDGWLVLVVDVELELLDNRYAAAPATTIRTTITTAVTALEMADLLVTWKTCKPWRWQSLIS